jgi:hypothetical protein
MSRIPNTVTAKSKVKSTGYLDEKDDEEPGEEPQQTVQYVHREVVPYNRRLFPFQISVFKKVLCGKNVGLFILILYIVCQSNIGAF